MIYRFIAQEVNPRRCVVLTKYMFDKDHKFGLVFVTSRKQVILGGDPLEHVRDGSGRDLDPPETLSTCLLLRGTCVLRPSLILTRAQLWAFHPKST